MAELKEIVRFLDNYLEHANVKDGSFNGLQFEGKGNVQKIMFAVDSGIDTFEKAVELGADMIVVHHGHFWDKNNPSLVGFSKKRFEILFKHGISLYASHLPLDKHPEVGNNAQLLKLIGAEVQGEFAEMDGQYISFIGSVEAKLSEIEKKLSEGLNTECHTLRFGREIVEKVAVCSGGGGMKVFNQAVEHMPDLYITGEPTEVYHAAKDAGINVIFAGHHATETVGVNALSKVVRENFSVETEFVDIPTGL